MQKHLKINNLKTENNETTCHRKRNIQCKLERGK